MEPIALRPCRQNDAAFLFGLHRVALGEYVAATWGWDDDDQRRRFEEAFIPADQQIITVGGVDAGVLRTNPGARRLYERLGFVVVGETATHLQMTNEPIPAGPGHQRPVGD